MQRVNYKRSFVPRVPQKSSYKRQKYGGYKSYPVSRSFYGRCARLNFGNRRQFVTSSLKDDVFVYDNDSDAGIPHGRNKVDYFTLPVLDQGLGCRHTNKIRAYTINFDGRVNVTMPDVLMAKDSGEVEIPNIEGFVGIFVVLDRMPTGSGLPTFDDVFGTSPNNIGSSLDQHVRVDQLSRFKVLIRERRYVNVSLHGSMFTLKRFIKFNGRSRFVTTFKNMGDNTSGRYGNVRDNALLLYVL